MVIDNNDLDVPDVPAPQSRLIRIGPVVARPAICGYYAPSEPG
jgi:hypothetical protein